MMKKLRRIISILGSLYVLALLGYGIFGLNAIQGVSKLSFREVIESRRMPWKTQPKELKQAPVISVETPESQAEIPLADFDNVG